MRIISTPRRTAGAVAGVLLAGTVLALPPAYGARPANDSVRRPTEVTVVPATLVTSAQGATSSPSDGACVYGASVWYRYRPTTTLTLRAVTAGSTNGTAIAVFTGPRSRRALVACEDSRFAAFNGVQKRFHAGHRYWIALSRCCSNARASRRAVLRLYQPAPAGIVTTIEKVEAGDISGNLVVTGRTVCTTPSSVELYYEASQRVGPGVAQSGGELYRSVCTSTGFLWRHVLPSSTGWAFQAGQKVAISWWSQADDGFQRVVDAQDVFPDVVAAPNARRRR
jgi:hypothetical protein